MSGYLQRLVQGAVKAEGSVRTPSIRPVLGSIYSAPRPSVFSEGFQESEAFAPREPEALEQGIEASEQSQEEALPRVRLEDPAKEPVPHNVAVLSLQIRPVRASDVQDQAPTPERERDNRGSHESIPISKPAASFQPLVAANAQLAASQAITLKSFDTFISAHKSKNKLDLSSRSEPAAQGTDEVQIHIGRIEVTAAPTPQAARPVQKSLRKAMNLDEYLKRSGRRGG